MFNLKKENKDEINFSLLIISSYVFFYTLYIWASFLIPFIIALLFSLAIIWLSNFYQRLKLNNIFSMILSLFTYLFIFWLITQLINSNIDELIKKLPIYQKQIIWLIKDFFQATHIPEPKNINEMLQKFNMVNIFKQVLSSITSIFSNTWMIFFYTLFIILEYRYFSDKLTLMVTDTQKRQNIINTIKKIKNDTKAYFIIKTIVSFFTAFFSYLVMASFRLDFAIFWSFLIFILNFIPNVGSIIALFFPISIALIQKNMTFLDFSFISIFLIWIQILMWNIVEPKFMWNRLNLSPLAILISLSFWWYLWWIIWMILSVPIMVIVNIILAKIPSTRPIAIMLSEKWELNIQTEEEIIQTRKKLLNKLRKKITLN